MCTILSVNCVANGLRWVKDGTDWSSRLRSTAAVAALCPEKDRESEGGFSAKLQKRIRCKALID